MKTLAGHCTLVVLTVLLASGFASTSKADATATNTPPRLITVPEAEKLVASKNVVVLDVRTPSEFAAGHIAGATNLDFHDKDFQAKLDKLDKNQPYLVHCAAGGRSGKASKLMSTMDFKSVYDLKGGLTAWEKAGKPVEK